MPPCASTDVLAEFFSFVGRRRPVDPAVAVEDVGEPAAGHVRSVPEERAAERSREAAEEDAARGARGDRRRVTAR